MEFQVRSCVYTLLLFPFLNLPSLSLEFETVSEEAKVEDAMEVEEKEATAAPSSSFGQLLSSLEQTRRAQAPAQPSTSLVEYKKPAALGTAQSPQTSALMAAGIKPRRKIKPKWHPPWKIGRVISGHLGWVRCVSVDPSNEWFVTGSADRTIKVRF